MDSHMITRMLHFAWVAVLLAAAPTFAQSRIDVPAPLLPWVPWVLADAPEHACAFGSGGALCRWPGKLRLELGARGGRWELRSFADRPLAIALPGGAGRWPSEVRVDGRTVAVLERAGSPAVALTEGAHRIEGSFAWNSLPERLEVPANIPQVSLSVEGRELAFPKRDAQGQLWLGKSGLEDTESDRLELDVSRKLEDGVPVLVTTRIGLRVAGRAREVSLGQVLLEDNVALAIESELPARLEDDGALLVQLRAGTYRIEIRSRFGSSPQAVAYRKVGPLWPDGEVWVWRADETLRQVELSGAPAVDPARTELEADWRGLPAFSLREGAALQLSTTRRGEVSPPPNRITLEREIWLDLDGSGYTARDTIGAQLHRNFRLDLLAGELGHVAVQGEDLLITKAADAKHSGIELREAEQHVVAEWRGAGALRRMKAVGWSEDVQALGATLHLGPGFSVLSASGVDGISQSWVQDWDLFDFFFVLLVVIAVARLIGWPAAALALLALGLAHGEADAPFLVWFVLLACIALLRVLPSGWLRGLVRAGYALTVVWLLVVTAPFAVRQIRIGLYPQLDDAGMSGGRQATRPVMLEPAPAEESASMVAPPASPAASGASAARKEYLSYDRADAAPSDADRGKGDARSRLGQDPEAIVQTGPGVPSWHWRTWQLRWSGPVDKAHELRLYLVPPPVNRGLAWLRVLLIAGLIAVLLRKAGIQRERPGGGEPAGETGSERAPGAGTVAGLVALAWLGTVPTAHAQLPDPALLDQLRARLTKPAECRPECAAIEDLLIDVSEGGLLLTATVHAGELTSVRLPGPASTWVPGDITLDRRADAPAVLLEDGFVHVRVEPGVHELEVRGALPTADTLTLAFADRPQHARVRASGFRVDGVREDGRVEDTVQLSRLLSAPRGETLRSDALPPWLLLERELQLGVRWQVRTRLLRVSPAGTPIRVRVPLLSGESVTESGLAVADSEVQVSFGRDQREVSWTSSLDAADQIELAASQGRPWSERWRVQCGPVWHCEFSGLSPIVPLPEGRWEPEFAPWPGERVSVAVRRPEPAAGASVTIDSAELDVTPGARLLDAALELSVRTSRGAVQTLVLPGSARVQSLAIDGEQRPIRVEKERVSFALAAGAHAVRVQWQQTDAQRSVMRTPVIGLGRPLANAKITLHVPDDRWLLWATGPAWGPALLFWGYLVLVLLVAVLLGRVPNTPLSTLQFVLLGLGLTQIPVLGALAIVSWFFAFGYRGRMPEQPRLRHNLLQLGLCVWTLVALGSLYEAVQAGLLLQPDMQVAGAGSEAQTLHWIVDRVSAGWPVASVVSVPLWIWRVLMLLWSLWLAVKLVGWSIWGFRCFKHRGLWKKPAPRPPRAPASPTAS
jgi:hypothetical protein